jgi:hypothetical protein
MVEATSSIAQIPTIRITTAAHALAQLRSRQAVKDALRAQGLKPTNYSAREITSWASVFLDDHHETLMPRAIEEARQMILAGALGKRAQRALAQAQDVHKTQPRFAICAGNKSTSLPLRYMFAGLRMARLLRIPLPVERCERYASINGRAQGQHLCLCQSVERRCQHQGSVG